MKKLFESVAIGILGTCLVGCGKSKTDVENADMKKTTAVSPQMLQSWKQYENKLTGFQIQYPPDWGIVENSRKAAVTLVADGISVEALGGLNQQRSETKPTESLSLEKAFEKHSANLKKGKPIRVQAGEAAAIQMSEATSGEDLTWLKVAVHGSCIYIVRARCPMSEREKFRSTLESIVNSFVIVRSVSANEVYSALTERSLPRDAEDLRKQQYELGMRLIAENSLEEAEASFLKATEIDSQWANPRIKLGVLYTTQNRWDEATGQARAAVMLAPRIPDTHHLMGMCYEHRGDTNLAVKEYENALSIDGKFAAARYNLARMFLEFDEDRCAKEAQELLALGDPNYVAHAHSLLGFAICNKRPDEARLHLEKFLELSQGRKEFDSVRPEAEKLLMRIKAR